MKIPGVPQNVEEFRVMRDQFAQTPEGGAVMFIIALKMYAANPKEGLKCLILQRDISDLIVSGEEDSYCGYSLPGCESSLIKAQLSRQPFLPDSYFLGASPSNSYSIPDNDLQIDISTNPFSGNPSSGKMKVFVRTNGAETARPVNLQRNNKGIWKVTEFSSLIVSVAKPGPA